MAKVDIKGWSVEVEVDLYNAGITEDGQEFHAEEFYVAIQRPDGYRLVHSSCWKGCQLHIMEECGGGYYFEDIRKEAKANAEALVARVKDVEVVDDANWFLAEPSYGSEAYCKKYGF